METSYMNCFRVTPQNHIGNERRHKISHAEGRGVIILNQGEGKAQESSIARPRGSLVPKKEQRRSYQAAVGRSQINNFGTVRSELGPPLDAILSKDHAPAP